MISLSYKPHTFLGLITETIIPCCFLHPRSQEPFPVIIYHPLLLYERRPNKPLSSQVPTLQHIILPPSASPTPNTIKRHFNQPRTPPPPSSSFQNIRIPPYNPSSSLFLIPKHKDSTIPFPPPKSNTQKKPTIISLFAFEDDRTMST